MNYGRKSFGAQRPVSHEVTARHIIESIRTHAAQGTVKTPEQYTAVPETLALIRAQLARQ